MIEKIDKAAVRISGVFYPSPERLALVFSVPRPLRHDAAIRACASALRLDRIGEHEQGFTTTTGRFVSREEAGKIAFATGQLTTLRRSLMSENVW